MFERGLDIVNKEFYLTFFSFLVFFLGGGGGAETLPVYTGQSDIYFPYSTPFLHTLPFLCPSRPSESNAGLFMAGLFSPLLKETNTYSTQTRRGAKQVHNRLDWHSPYRTVKPVSASTTGKLNEACPSFTMCCCSGGSSIS